MLIQNYIITVLLAVILLLFLLIRAKNKNLEIKSGYISSQEDKIKAQEAIVRDNEIVIREQENRYHNIDFYIADAAKI